MKRSRSARDEILAQLQQFAADQPAPFDFHVHTVWTDGQNSSLEMYQEAVRVGLEVMLFSEHARKSSDWFGQFAEEIRALPKLGCAALIGVEVKALDFEGNIDCSEEILEECQLVMGSVHREKAARTGVAFEVNAHYHPDPWFLIGACRKAGATISLGSNAHALGDVGRILRVLRGQEPPWNPSGP